MDTTVAALGTLSDEEVIARVLSGEVAAYELLMRRHNQRLFRTARSVVHDDLEAEDIVQETLVRAYTHLSAFEGRSSVATWLTRIAFHESLRRKRRGTRALAATRSLAESRLPAALEPEEPDMNDADDTRSIVTRTLDALPMSQRSVVVLRLVHGLSTRETAESLGLSEANVKVMLHRGRRSLEKQLDPSQLASLGNEFAFDGKRCDRVVDTVFRRLGVSPDTGQRHPGEPEFRQPV